MMYRTCTVQVNLDFASEADMVKKFRVGLALQPVATALFANSPFFEGKVNGWQSWRARIWQDTDPDRTGMLPFVFEDGMGFERYVDYALDVPMYFVYRDGRYIDALGQSLPRLPRRPAAGAAGREADALGLGRPSDDDLPRGAAEEASWRCAAPTAGRGGGSARCRRSGSGCSTTQASLDAAWDLCRGWTAEERDALRHDAGKHGLRAEIGGRSLREVAGEVLAISEAGLKARARPGAGGMIADETHFLNALKEIVASGMTASDELLARYAGDWDGDLKRIYADYSY